MKVNGIEICQTVVASKLEIKFETAKAIRALLDKAIGIYGDEAAEDANLVEEILELVTGGDE